MPYLSIFILPLLMALALTARVEKQSQSQAQLTSYSPEIRRALPELLPRNPSVGSTQEQNKVMETYDMLSKAIDQGPSNHRKRIQLAQLLCLKPGQLESTDVTIPQLSASSTIF